jgi:hypothetical protein
MQQLIINQLLDIMIKKGIIPVVIFVKTLFTISFIDTGLTLSVAIVAICDYFLTLAIIFAFWLQNLAIIFYFQQCLYKV